MNLFIVVRYASLQLLHGLLILSVHLFFAVFFGVVVVEIVLAQILQHFLGGSFLTASKNILDGCVHIVYYFGVFFLNLHLFIAFHFY